jgi:hypothetical protein
MLDGSRCRNDRSYAQKWCMEEKREKAYPAGIPKTPRVEIHHE